MAPMSERHDPHADEASVGPHGAGDHGETHGHDDHAHLVEGPGPVDLRAWAAALLGIALGLVVMVAFIQAGT
jgi:hypothetical protein